MDALRLGTATVDFQESLDPGAPLECLAPVVAALMSGFKLAATNGGTVGNIEHCYVGRAHPRDFKTAKRAEIMRVIGFRFRAGARVINGEAMRVEQFIAQYQADAALRAQMAALPAWDANLAIIDAKIRATEPAVKAGYDARRTLLIPMRAEPEKEKLREWLLARFEG